MKIADVLTALEIFAPPVYQESYDNAGLLVGNADWNCTGILCTLDATEAVVHEARAKGCNLLLAHHPIIFSGLKKITGRNYVESTVIAAIKHDVAIYAMHTNLDNVINGVNDKIADRIGLVNRKILFPKKGLLMKLFTFAPAADAENVRNAVFQAGGGQIGNYSECSFNAEGTGTFKAEPGATPYVGDVGKRHQEREVKMEFIFPAYLQQQIIASLLHVHPYEEVAYDIVPLANEHPQIGSGLIGVLPEAVTEMALLEKISHAFTIPVIKHTKLLNRPVRTVALCGGAGSFLISAAIAAGAGFYITADVKYHEFFDANDRLVIADIGHWESEQFTVELFFDIIQSKFPNFAVLKSEVRTNPVSYFSYGSENQ